MVFWETEMTKAQLRRELKRKRAALSPEERRQCSLRICALVEASPVFRQARTVFLFASFGTEVDTFPLLGRALLSGKRVALPRTLLSEKRLVFHRIFTLGELVPGAYGIPEPPPENPVVPCEEADLVLVPGLAFDREGFRLGYGGGFYDRILRKIRAPRVGLAFSFQLIERVPREEHDLPVDGVVTEKGWFWVRPPVPPAGPVSPVPPGQ